MNNEKELIEARRKAFEVWAEISGLNVTRSTVDMMFGSGERVGAGEYFQPTKLTWQAWQAALDSVVVELPEPANPEYHEGDDQHNITLEDCRNAIHAAGIKAKVKA